MKNGIEKNKARIREVKESKKTTNVASGMLNFPEAIGRFFFAGCFLSYG